MAKATSSGKRRHSSQKKTGAGTWIWRITILLGPGGAAFAGFVLFATGLVNGNPTTWALPFGSLGFPAGMASLAGALGIATPEFEIQVGSIGVMAYVMVMPIYLAMNPTIPAADVMNIYPTATQVCIACLGILQVEHGHMGIPWLLKLIPSIALSACFIYRYHTDPSTDGMMLTSALTICGFQFAIAYLQEYYVRMISKANENLTTESQSRQRLLQASFDATCWLRLPGIPHNASVDALDPSKVALEVTRSSPQFDSLFGKAMQGQRLGKHCVVHGLDQLREVAVQAMAASMTNNEIPVARANFTGLDIDGAEFDCEVRAVPEDSRVGRSRKILCGLRVGGEKRKALHYQPEPDNPVNTGSTQATEASGPDDPLLTKDCADVPSDNESETSVSSRNASQSDKEPEKDGEPFWTKVQVALGFRNPDEPQETSKSLLGRAEDVRRAPFCSGAVSIAWEAIRSVPGAACVACTLPSLRIWDATAQGLALLPMAESVHGQLFPAFVANAQAAQTLRRAISIAVNFANQNRWSNGYIVREFGTLGLRSVGLSPLTMHVTMLLVAAKERSEDGASLFLIFRAVTAGILRKERERGQAQEGPEPGPRLKDDDAVSESSKSTCSRVTWDEESIAASSRRGGQPSGLRRRKRRTPMQSPQAPSSRLPVTELAVNGACGHAPEKAPREQAAALDFLPPTAEEEEAHEEAQVPVSATDFGEGVPSQFPKVNEEDDELCRKSSDEDVEPLRPSSDGRVSD